MNAGLLGAIFDWDGVIIDSQDQHEASWVSLGEELGKAISHEQFTGSFGMRNAEILTRVLGWAGETEPARVRMLGDRKEELYREIVRLEGIEPLPGVRELLTGLRDARIPCAVGTSTPIENVEAVMKLTGLGDGYFSGICAAADVRHGKPAPDVFLEAARRIGRAPGDCVVFEDAPVGIEAARRAGAKVIAVATTHPASALVAADWVVASLAEVTLDDILKLW